MRCAFGRDPRRDTRGSIDQSAGSGEANWGEVGATRSTLGIGMFVICSEESSPRRPLRLSRSVFGINRRGREED